MMKRIVLVSFMFVLSVSIMAQHNVPQINTYSDEEAGDAVRPGFNRGNMFVGGTLNIGYNGYDFNVGGTPEIGYSLNKWFDVGALVNINYTSERADPTGYFNNDTRYRSFNYGAGVFGRFYPLPFLFLQVEPEYNFVNYATTPMQTGTTTRYQTQAPSFLGGIGYGRRIVGESSFYLLLMFDVLGDHNSPYVDPYTYSPLPVIKAGFDVYLHPRRK